MNCRIVKANGDVEDVEREPVCGEDYCEQCGDCLVCHWEDPCYGNDGGEHSFFIDLRN